MAKFLNTSATNYHLEEIIKGANDRLILISPFLKLNDRMRELLEDKNRLKIDVRIVYGKSELQPEEISWLRGLDFVRTSFCKNLHAKCYLSENACIITSLNLYEFSQVNNNEMGILITRSDDSQLYRDTYDEAQRIIRISDEIRISMEKVSSNDVQSDMSSSATEANGEHQFQKLTAGNLSKQMGIKMTELSQLLLDVGYLEDKGGKNYLTKAGRDAGGEWRMGQHGGYFLWPTSFAESLKK
ncbi:MAG: phospholipase D family protein [Phycisphaerae bacterium]|nr:phospholipase D family protein [Phycisphaerae bacterium]